MKRLIPLFFLLLLIFTACSNESSAVHTVVFDDGYGNTFVQDVQDGKTVTKPYKDPAAPESAKKGKFKAWITKSGSGAETEYDFSQPVKRDLHLYALYHEAFTVTFLNGTSLYETQLVSDGDKAVKPSRDPENPTMGALEGWATDPEKMRQTAYDFNTPVKSDITLYAYYKEAKYVTLLDPDGKEIGEKIKVSYKDILAVPDLTECASRLIEKWQVKKGEDYEDYDFSLPVETDLTLKAVCYDTLPSSSLTIEDALSVMRFAEVLASSTGNESGDGTTAGFRNEDLIKLFLAGSHDVDKSTMNFHYPNAGIYYDLYISGENLYVPENILYYEITDATDAKRYNRNYEDGKTTVTAEDFTIYVKLAKGSLKDGKVVKDKDSDFFNPTALSLTLKSVNLEMDREGNIAIKFMAGAVYYDFTLSSEHTEKSTVSTIVLKKTDTEDRTRSGSGAAKLTFYTVTFDPNNGDEVKTTRLYSTTDGVKAAKPDLDPVDREGNHSFRFWTKNGVEYDFNSPVGEDTVLTAEFLSHEDYYNKMLTAECIYRISTLLSSYENIFTGYKIVDERLFPDTIEAKSDLGKILLSALFSIDPLSEKLFLTYNGEKFIYEDNPDFSTIRVQGQSEIKANNSKKDGNTLSIKIDDFKLTLEYKYKYNTGAEKTWKDLSETFSIDASIVSSGTEGKTKVTTAVLTIGGKTYSRLIATATTIESGKTEVVYEYEGLRFTRVY